MFDQYLNLPRLTYINNFLVKFVFYTVEQIVYSVVQVGLLFINKF